MTKEQRISLNLVHRVLDYDPITGIFVWKPWSKQFDARWAGKRAGHVNNHGYRIIYLGGEGYLAHRLAWFYHYGEWQSITKIMIGTITQL